MADPLDLARALRREPVGGTEDFVARLRAEQQGARNTMTGARDAALEALEAAFGNVGRQGARDYWSGVYGYDIPDNVAWVDDGGAMYDAMGNPVAMEPMSQSMRMLEVGGDLLGPAVAGIGAAAKGSKAAAQQLAEALRGGTVAASNTGGAARMADDLPMDEARRMQRAADLGYTVDAYHGTKGDIRAFDPARMGGADGAADSRNTFSFASNADTASHYAGTGAPQVIDPARRAALEARFYEHSASRPVSDGAWVAYLEGNAEPKDVAAIDKWLSEGREIETALEANVSDAPNVLPVRLRMTNPLIVDRGGEGYDPEFARQQIIRALDAGNDGVIYRNTYDGGPLGDIYQVFDPANIRSRFAAFDPARAHEADLLAASGTGTAARAMNDEGAR